MKRWIGFGLFLAGLVLAIATYSGAARSSNFDSLVLDFRESLGPAAIEATVADLRDRYGADLRLNSEFSQADNLYVMASDREASPEENRARLRELRRELGDRLEFASPNYRYYRFEVPDDPDYSKQWNLRNINIEAAWDDTHGEGITVAVIDTGVSPLPDLAETQLVPGYNFVDDSPDARDDAGHGTHVAGTIAQTTNNGYGVAGVAHGAKIMPLKVLGASGGGEIADIAEAIRYAADNGADVINLSLGGSGDSPVLREAIAYAADKGLVLVAAAGNANQNAASYPARYPQVIGVSALGPTGQKAPYSNFGAGVDLSAPGGAIAGEDESGGILQETLDPNTGKPAFLALQGTSMASPHVAGVAALVKASGVEDPAEVAAVLKQSARAIDEDALNHYGAGQLDAAAAVKLAARGKVDLRDFLRWLRTSGYLNLKFWIDGGAVALLPKLAMVLGSYLLAVLLRVYFPFAWSASLAGGLVAGSSGLFFLRGVYLFDAPQWPFRVLGSSLPELGSALQGSPALNPLFASALIPLALLALLLGHPVGKRFALGATVGVAACLGVSAIADPALVWLGSGLAARAFLLANAGLCLGLAWLAVQTFPEVERPA